MQSTDHVLMIRPVRFQSNPDTAASNAFQRAGHDPAASQAAALAEFDAYVAALRQAGVGVLVVNDSHEPHTPDSIFPNNWFSCDRDGRVFLYPMAASNRRFERRPAVLAELERHFLIREVFDLSAFEQQSLFLEGTGSMVLDHRGKTAYACHSSRSHPAMMAAFSALTGYRAHWFNAVDRSGFPIYHTNVMMSVGSTLAVVCLDAVADARERLSLSRALRESGRDVIGISHTQVEQFAGNMLELRSADGSPVFAASRRAWAALLPSQRAQISACATPVLAPIDTIESLGGGSARCMLAEIFLPIAAGIPGKFIIDQHLR